MRNWFRRHSPAFLRPDDGFPQIDENQSVETAVDTDPETTGLFALHGEGISKDASRAVDIIAVHGLGGHYKTTWTCENGALWLADFLPQQLSENDITARIFSFGYNAKTLITNSVLDIGDIARNLLNRIELERDSDAEKQRPIIFIAHSLGGIIVKKVSTVVRNVPFSDIWPGHDTGARSKQSSSGSLKFDTWHRVSGCSSQRS